MVTPTQAAKQLRKAAKLLADPNPVDRVDGPVLALARQALQVDAVALAGQLGVSKQRISTIERIGLIAPTATSYLDACIHVANAQRVAAR